MVAIVCVVLQKNRQPCGRKPGTADGQVGHEALSYSGGQTRASGDLVADGASWRLRIQGPPTPLTFADRSFGISLFDEFQMWLKRESQAL